MIFLYKKNNLFRQKTLFTLFLQYGFLFLQTCLLFVQTCFLFLQSGFLFMQNPVILNMRRWLISQRCLLQARGDER